MTELFGIQTRRHIKSVQLLKPFLKAYGLAYASVIGPRLLKLVISIRKTPKTQHEIRAYIYAIILRASASNGFPLFCGIVVGGYTWLQAPLRFLLRWIASWLGHKPNLILRGKWDIIPQFLSAYVSAWVGLGLLNRTPLEHPAKEIENVSNEYANEASVREQPPKRPRLLAGSSMDLTLFAVSRAMETLIHDFWVRRRKSRERMGRWTAFERMVSRYADSWLFATSAGTVMWAWFYLPHRLPQAYNAWIKSAAEVDDRLVEVLRRARCGHFVYGKDTGQAAVLQSMCKDYGWPLIWGDPHKTVPLPCEMVHMGSGPSCHWHAVVRFFKAFKFALAMYLPLQILLRIRHPSQSQFQTACREAARSSAFLGAFVSLFYYGVCLSRTQLGPKIVSKHTVTPMMWDSGLCVRAGCILCGWSILIEAEQRRQELAMFVLPRAAATFVPRKYDKKHFWKERVAFSLSTAIILTLAHRDSKNIRGILGGVLHSILA